MLYDNGGLPAPQHPIGAMGTVAYTPKPRPPKPTYKPPAPKPNPNAYQPPQMNAPGVAVNPQMAMPGAYGFPRPLRGGRRTLRNQLAMGSGMQPNRFPQQGGMQQQMGYYRPPQQQAYNPVAAQFQYMMPQYQGNPYMPMVLK